MTTAVAVNDLWKSFRLYHERNQYLKAAILQGPTRPLRGVLGAQGRRLRRSPTGETFGVIGSNGSGKSTLLKTMAGILQPEKGSVEIKGRVSALLELGAGFHPELTGTRERVPQRRHPRALEEGDHRTLRRHRRVRRTRLISSTRPVKNYSSGMFVRLGFAVAAHVDPDVLLIDEVLSVGDESFQRRCAEKIDQFRRDGRTIVLRQPRLGPGRSNCVRTSPGSTRASCGCWARRATSSPRYQGQSHQAERVEGEQGSRWGSGEAQIVNVDLLDGDGQKQSVLNTNESVTIHVDITAHTPLQDTVLGVRIDSLNGGPVWGTSTRRNGKTIGLIDGPASVDIAIPGLPLLEGVYDLTVALTDHTEIHPYDHWERRIRFEVRQFKSYDTGMVSIPAQWTITGARGVVQSG